MRWPIYTPICPVRANQRPNNWEKLLKDTINKLPRRLYSLDVIRGIAALSVVFWHWQHFFFNGTVNGRIDKATQPLYPLFFLFYERGRLAVEFFFSLSGFIFFWLYARRVSHKEISAWDFSVLRFSRLYPLHLITLLIVLAGQQFIRYRTGSFFVYPKNDLYHFILQIFFASNWGLERGFSFNAPIWSVSIEVLLYVIFFIVCRKLPIRMPLLFLLTAVGFGLTGIFTRLGRGMFSFFIGGMVYLVYLKLVEKNRLAAWLRPLVVVTLLGWAVTVLDMRISFIRPAFLEVAQPLLTFNGYDYASWIAQLFYDRLATGILFPLTILALVAVETQRGHLGQRVAFLGNLSYSSYLLHFPLQMLFFIIIGLAGVDNSFFYSPFSLLLFFAILVTLSLMSYRFWEAPAQQALRNRLLSVRYKRPGLTKK